MALDADVIRLAEGPNLATVVTLMPDGQPQALLTWVDTDGEHVGTDYANPIGPDGRIILQVAPDKINTPKSIGRRTATPFALRPCVVES